MTTWLTNYDDIHASRHYWLWLPKKEHSPDCGWPTELGYAHNKVIFVHGDTNTWRGFDFVDARHGIKKVLDHGGKFCLVERPDAPASQEKS